MLDEKIKMDKFLKDCLLKLLMIPVVIGVIIPVFAACGCGSHEEERVDENTKYRILDLDTIAGRRSLDTITAESWLLVDSALCYPVCGKNFRKRMFPASITKMMTCILALENAQDKMDDTIEITKDVYIAKNSRVRLGDTYQMKHLMMEMMMLSDNDAAFAIAKYVAGDTLSFCKMMNKKAKDLNMRRTHFANPNGMPNDHNYSTAEDLVKLMAYCMKNKRFAEIVGTLEADIPLADGRHIPSKNTNRLLEEYPGCIGVKTGFINASGGCLAVAARRDGITLYLVMLNSKWGRRFTEAPLILDYGFNVVNAARDALKGD